MFNSLTMCMATISTTNNSDWGLRRDVSRALATCNFIYIYTLLTSIYRWTTPTTTTITITTTITLRIAGDDHHHPLNRGFYVSITNPKYNTTTATPL